jgi:hypothetical protein
MFKPRTLVLIVAVALLAGCGLGAITGSGNVITQEEAIADFEKLDVSNGFRVEVSQGDSFGVVIRIDDNLVEHLQVAKEGNTLKIGLKPGRLYNILGATVEADVTMPELTGLDLSGGSRGTVTGFESTRDLALDLSGGSHATLAGSAGDVTIDASGGSEADLSGFSVADARVEASGGSEVTLDASGRLDVDASGGSRVYYLGSPTLGTIEQSGGSTMAPR